MRYELTDKIMNEAWEEYKVSYPVPEHWSRRTGGTSLYHIRDIVSTTNFAGGPNVLLEIVEDEARLVLDLENISIICSRHYDWMTLPDGLAGFHLVLSRIYGNINYALKRLGEELSPVPERHATSDHCMHCHDDCNLQTVGVVEMMHSDPEGDAYWDHCPACAERERIAKYLKSNPPLFYSDGSLMEVTTPLDWAVEIEDGSHEHRKAFK